MDFRDPRSRAPGRDVRCRRRTEPAMRRREFAETAAVPPYRRPATRRIAPQKDVRLVGLGLVELHVDDAFTRECTRCQRTDAAVTVGSDHEGYVGRSGRQLFAQMLRHAAGNTDHQTGILLAMLEQLRRPSVDPIFGLLSDRRPSGSKPEGRQSVSP